jgi:hypothetical protein
MFSGSQRQDELVGNDQKELRKHELGSGFLWMKSIYGEAFLGSSICFLFLFQSTSILFVC